MVRMNSHFTSFESRRGVTWVLDILHFHNFYLAISHDIVSLRVLYKLEYYDHGLLTYSGVITLLEKHE